MKNTIFSLFLALVTTTANSAEPLLVDGVAAYVNDRVVTMSDVSDAMAPLEAQVREQMQGEQLQKALAAVYRRTLHSLIARHLILSEFERQGLEIPTDMIDRQAKDIVNGKFDGDMSRFEDALAGQGMTLSDWRQQIHDSIVLRSMRARELRTKVEVSPRAIRDYYDENVSKFSQKGGVHLQVIVFTVIPEQRNRGEKLEQAGRALEQLRAGTPFGKVAAEMSDGLGAERGGDWGWMDPTELRKEIADVVAGLKTGATSEVVEVGDEIYIIRVLERREPGTLAFEDVRGNIERELREAEEERLYQDWVRRLQSRGYVKVLDVNLLR